MFRHAAQCPLIAPQMRFVWRDWWVAQAMRMDVAQNNSPFLFEPEELPVIMIFPANNKKPLEFTGRMSIEALESFVLEHADGQQSKMEL